MKDPNLSMCSPATRGIWMDALCAMHELDRCGQITGTTDQLARICRCTSVEMSAAVDELFSTKAAIVSIRDGIVTLANRRMKDECEARLATNERVVKHRSNNSSSSSTSSSSSDNPLPPELDCDEFRKKLSEFRAYRKDRKPHLTASAEAALIRKVRSWGAQKAVMALENSMANSWQGVFEPDSPRVVREDAKRAAVDAALEAPL